MPCPYAPRTLGQPSERLAPPGGLPGAEEALLSPMAPAPLWRVAPCFWRVLTFMSKPSVRLQSGAGVRGVRQAKIIHGVQQKQSAGKCAEVPQPGQGRP